MMYSNLYSNLTNRSLPQRIFGALMFIVIVTLFLYLFYQIYRLLFLLSPLFLFAAVLLFPKVIFDHLKSIGLAFKQNLIGGLTNLTIQIIGLPLVSIGLVFKAWAYRKFGQLQGTSNPSKSEDEFVSYEEVDSTTNNQSVQKTKSIEKEKAYSAYEDLFE
ncbi:MAG: hypothetical protein LKG19_03560 [Saprospiraceae bacterium]|nr:hypothetical protein [Saprospiraceae bacterium]